jgi:hypothetical protein
MAGKARAFLAALLLGLALLGTTSLINATTPTFVSGPGENGVGGG